MQKNTQAPPILLARTIRLFIKNNVSFPKDLNGSIIKDEEEDFMVFRKVLVNTKGRQASKQPVILKVFFRFKRFSFKVNRILSLIPIPFIIAQPGFKSKTWLTGKETGTFYGFYEWDNIENAKHYLDSYMAVDTNSINDLSSCPVSLLPDEPIIDPNPTIFTK